MVGLYLVRSSSRRGMVPVATRSRMLAAMPLPMPGMARRSFGVGVGRGEGGELGGLLLDGFGCAAVGADAEGVGGVDFEQGGGFVEQAGEGDVVHSMESAANTKAAHPIDCSMR